MDVAFMEGDSFRSGYCILRFATSRWIACWTVLLPACGSDRLPTYPANGRVLCDGRPAVNAEVVLHPVAPSEGARVVRPHGRVDREGRFGLTTFQRGDGAPAGTYRVTLRWPQPRPGASPLDPDPENARGGPDQLHGRYRDPDTSGLTLAIEPRPNKLAPIIVDLTVSSEKPR